MPLLKNFSSKTGFTYLLVLLCMGSCSKNNIPVPTNQPDPVVVPLLRSIVFDNGTVASLFYNNDSTLKKISYQFQNTVSNTVFNWENGRLKEMYDEQSLYKNSFYYSGETITHFVNTYKQVQLPSPYQMEYSYDELGKLNTLQYSTTNEAGTVLKATSSYYYNNSGELEQVITQNGNAVYTHIIEGYSDTAIFNPLVFVETTLFENYPIFNLPVLQAMKKYPSKIIRKVKIGEATAYIDKIDENDCLVENKLIRRINFKITSPGMPQYENKLVADFNYSG